MSVIRTSTYSYSDAIDSGVVAVGDDAALMHYHITDLPLMASGSGSRSVLKLKGAGKFTNICSFCLRSSVDLIIATAFHLYIEATGKDIMIGVDSSEHDIPVGCKLDILVTIQ